MGEPSFSTVAVTADELPPTRSLEQTELLGRSQQVFQDVPDGMSDAELNRHIADTHYLSQLAMARYRGSHCFGDLGESHRWQLLHDQAKKTLHERRVARARAERGLA